MPYRVGRLRIDCCLCGFCVSTLLNEWNDAKRLRTTENANNVNDPPLNGCLVFVVIIWMVAASIYYGTMLRKIHISHTCDLSNLFDSSRHCTWSMSSSLLLYRHFMPFVDVLCDVFMMDFFWEILRNGAHARTYKKTSQPLFDRPYYHNSSCSIRWLLTIKHILTHLILLMFVILSFVLFDRGGMCRQHSFLCLLPMVLFVHLLMRSIRCCCFFFLHMNYVHLRACAVNNRFR